MHDGSNEKNASIVFDADESCTGPVECLMDPIRLVNGTSPMERRGVLFVPAIPSLFNSKLEPTAIARSRAGLDLEDQLPISIQLVSNSFGDNYFSYL